MDRIEFAFRALIVKREAERGVLSAEIVFGPMDGAVMAARIHAAPEGGPRETLRTVEAPDAGRAAQAALHGAIQDVSASGGTIRAAMAGSGGTEELGVRFVPTGVLLVGGSPLAPVAALDFAEADLSSEPVCWAVAKVADGVSGATGLPLARPVATWRDAQEFLGLHGIFIALGVPKLPELEMAGPVPGPR